MENSIQPIQLLCGGNLMPVTPLQTRDLFHGLRPGDQVEVEHTVTVGMKSWTTTTRGAVVRTERRRHGLHFRRNFDDKVFSDILLLRLPDGQLTTVTLDEFTKLRKPDTENPK
jgi:hypothetical protein